MRCRILLVVVLSICLNSCVEGQSVSSDNILESKDISTVKKDPPFLKYGSDAWVSSTFDKLTLREKIGQLIVTRIDSRSDTAKLSEQKRDILELGIGSVLYTIGDSYDYAELTNDLRSQNKVPIMTTIDGEWGLGMRYSDLFDYPYNLTLGAIQDDSLLFQMGVECAEQFKMAGVDLNFGPVVDVNTNPKNPVIGYRSYGENPDNVGNKALSFIDGMQSLKIGVAAKHFPGHGDTEVDSHYGLPTLNHSKGRLDSIELKPFKRVIDGGVGVIMSGHIQVAVWDSLPASLSKNILTGILRDSLNFKGIIISDAMAMKAITKHFSDGEAAVMAIEAGNDMLEALPDDRVAIDAIESAVNSGRISLDLIDEKCRKVLSYKRWVGLNRERLIDTSQLSERLNSGVYLSSVDRMYEAAQTVLVNRDNYLPIKRASESKIAVVIVGSEKSIFPTYLKRYADVDSFYLPKESSKEKIEQIKRRLRGYDVVICGVVGLSSKDKGDSKLDYIYRDICSFTSSLRFGINVLFGSPYFLKEMDGAENGRALIVSNSEVESAMLSAAQLIFGATGADGKLPVSVDSRFKVGDGIKLEANGILRYGLPESVGLDGKLMNHLIDSIISDAIEQKAFPGGQLVVAKGGTVIVDKTFGYHTFDKKREVSSGDLYDWASLTKMTSATLALMQLYDKGEIDLDSPYSDYWTDWKGSNKEKLTLREILAHQARLKPYINYFQYGMNEDKSLNKELFIDEKDSKHKLRVSKDIFLDDTFIDTIYHYIRESEIYQETKYRYSGLSFITYPELVYDLTGEHFDSYVQSNIYNPIGAYSVCFNPIDRYPLNKIAPTEVDNYYRHRLVHGYVHDECAALLGGVSGNAGLFGTANDCAKIMQMLLNGGSYGGTQIITEKAVDQFTSRQYLDGDNRRGLGFDKPAVDNSEDKPEDAYPSIHASASSYGHTGFTGTMAWVDPECDLVFVFFSNRVYPTRNNSLLYKLNVRTQILDILYDSIDKGI